MRKAKTFQLNDGRNAILGDMLLRVYYWKQDADLENALLADCGVRPEQIVNREGAFFTMVDPKTQATAVHIEPVHGQKCVYIIEVHDLTKTQQERVLMAEQRISQTPRLPMDTIADLMAMDATEKNNLARLS